MTAATGSPSLDPFLIVPDWPVDGRVGAAVTTRVGGVSTGAWGDADGRGIGLNLGAHVGDEPRHVAENRRRLQQAVPGPVHWLEQVHGTRVHWVEGPPGPTPPVADAAITSVRGQVLAVMTADCLPVLLADRQGRCIGVAHAGWRGLSAGIVEATVEAMRQRLGPQAALLAWLGPAIGPDAFEVGGDVREAFCAADPAAGSAFRPGPMPGKWFCNLYRLARLRLRSVGIDTAGGGDRCTLLEPEAFFSHRRDRVTGRFASLVWLA
jgi:polyphenol oxidase